MKIKQLGRTGLRVSEICLGTMTFAAQADVAAANAIMDTAAEHGVTFMDTADVYPVPTAYETFGRTEEIVGDWLVGKRDAFVLATKCHMPASDKPNDRGNSRRHIVKAVEASLRRLKTDYIDLYQIHRWDDRTPIEETLAAFDDLRRAGKILYAGCSNTPAVRLMEALWTSDVRGLVRFDCIQPRYNLLYRDIEAELVPACETFGVGIIAYNPLAGGLLTGKYKATDAPHEATRFTLGGAGELYRRRYWQDATLDVAERLANDVASRGKSLTHVALRWMLDRPAITSAIVGASRAEQLADSLKALDVRLDDADGAACDEAWYALPRRKPEDER